ncbi:hypothetical protein LSCM4_04068 [Leishmania orientalis]|uniref:Uncharacterized protein n=1 Tax=Leishmania orientalis TaxID=2249476 RepID=A0A836H4B3_9TRYP|nr:hypothetical protein LSCM4_04068 [Leishmania orientalis]
MGSVERTSSSVRLQDAHAWSLTVNEKSHRGLVKQEYYCICLNPQLIVGEKLVHYVHERRSYIIGEETGASLLGFCVMPPLADGDTLHRSVYSAHGREHLQRGAARLKPECGTTYVHNELIIQKTPMLLSGCTILGNQLAFRFGEVGAEVPRARKLRILDWGALP